MFARRTFAVACTLVMFACSSSSEPSGRACKADSECGAGTEFCDRATSRCAPRPQGAEIGRGDGSAASVTLTEIYAMPAAAKPVDIAFNPDDPSQLWVIGHGDDAVYVGSGVDGDAPTWRRFLDPAAEHFMHRPPAMAMGHGGTWATCGDNDNSQNATGDGAAIDFMGPALFTTDLNVFAKRATALGSHLDMLHNTPFCRGIAHVEANWYWAFNAKDLSLDRYNFGADHGPGMDDHSDGEIYRYARGQVKGAEGTPSHVVFDASDGFLYVADTGNGRIVRLDTTSGTRGKQLPRQYEPLADNAIMEGTAVEVVVDTGVLELPSGIEVRGDLLYVTDAATSMFHVFDKTGKAIRSLATGLPAGSLAGFTFGPDGKIWFTDSVGGRVLRIDP